VVSYIIRVSFLHGIGNEFLATRVSCAVPQTSYHGVWEAVIMDDTLINAGLGKSAGGGPLVYACGREEGGPFVPLFSGKLLAITVISRGEPVS
jgi:hypothetical protein